MVSLILIAVFCCINQYSLFDCLFVTCRLLHAALVNLMCQLAHALTLPPYQGRSPPGCPHWQCAGHFGTGSHGKLGDDGQAEKILQPDPELSD